MIEFDNFNPNINFTYEFGKENINFLHLNVKLSHGKLQTPCMLSSQITISTFTFNQVIPNMPKGQ